MTLIRQTFFALSTLVSTTSAQAGIADAASTGTRITFAAGDHPQSFAAQTDVGDRLPGAGAPEWERSEDASAAVDGMSRSFATTGSTGAQPSDAGSGAVSALFDVSDDGTLALAPIHAVHLENAPNLGFFAVGRAYADHGVDGSTHVENWLPESRKFTWAWKPDKPSTTTPIVSSIPEPSQYALLLAGLMAIGLTARRLRG